MGRRLYKNRSKSYFSYKWKYSFARGKNSTLCTFIYWRIYGECGRWSDKLAISFSLWLPDLCKWDSWYGSPGWKLLSGRNSRSKQFWRGSKRAGKTRSGKSDWRRFNNTLGNRKRWKRNDSPYADCEASGSAVGRICEDRLGNAGKRSSYSEEIYDWSGRKRRRRIYCSSYKQRAGYKSRADYQVRQTCMGKRTEIKRNGVRRCDRNLV